MALSTVKISDTMEWSKKLSFNRLSAIGNNLEPALTSANMVMQTILGPPFSWWWNNQELTFTCNTTPVTGAITNVAITAGVVTLTITSNPFVVGNLVIPSALTTATFLNGKILNVLTASGTTITANIQHADYVSAADTGTLTMATVQDYSVNAPTFSHIEHASVLDITKTPSKWWELQVKENLSLDSIPARPSFISPHTEDGNGTVNFRVMPAPAANYPVAVHVQLAAPLITSINQTWSPMPDYMRYIYSWGFLALIWAFSDDPRFAMANSKFTAGLLARAEGLTEQDRNIFLNNWNSLTGMDTAKHQQGMQARAT